MNIYKFHGGAHPRDHKKQSRYFKIENIPAPKGVILPLTQHIGARSVPIVNEGDKVLYGQKIAEADGIVSSNLHSPISGVVEKIAPHMHPDGLIINSIFIKNDFQDIKDPGIRAKKSRSFLSAAEIIEAVREAGIVGMGGAAFPTHVKLNVPPDKKVKNIIVNGCECEPYLTSDHRVMLEYPEKIITGALIIARATNAEKIYIAIENNKKDAIETLKQYTKDHDNISVVELPAKYPQGGEKQLIYSILGVEIPHGKLPLDLGVIVNNVDTCVAVAECLEEGLPLTHRIVTVAGSCFNHAQNYKVPIGTPISHIIEAHGGFKDKPKRLLLGGPMMGYAQVNLDVPVIKGTSAILALAEKDIEKERETPCIRCGRCVSGCPVRLRPINIAQLSQRNEAQGMREENIADCIECGVCSYHCPAKIHLLQWIKSGKTQVAVNK